MLSVLDTEEYIMDKIMDVLLELPQMEQMSLRTTPSFLYCVLDFNSNYSAA